MSPDDPPGRAGPDPGGRPAPARTAFVVFAIALAVLWICAAPRELTKTDEHRYVTVAREFLATGDWLVCRLNGATYTHKPPGWFWVAAIAKSLGATWTIAAMVPGTLAAAGTAALVFAFADRAWGRLAAWSSAVALLSMKEVLTVSVRGQIDPLVMFCAAGSLCASASVVLPGSPARGRAARTAVAWLSAGLGLLVKGPVAWLMAGAPVAALLIGTQGLRGLARRGWIFAPLAILPAAAWAVAAAARAPEGWDYIRALAIGQGVGHAAGQVDKLEPWHFYLRVLPLGLLPWTFLVPAALRVRARDSSRERDAVRFAAAWFVVPVVLMSLVPAKRDLYLLPAYPGAALLLGHLAHRVRAAVDVADRPVVRWGLRCVGGTAAVVGAALLALGVADLTSTDGWLARTWPAWAAVRGTIPPSATAWALLLGAGSVIAGVLLLRARTFDAAARPTAAVAAVVVIGTATVHAPFTEASMSPRAFLRIVRERVGDAWLGDYGGTDYAANWICDRSVVPFVDTRRDAEDVLARTPGPVYFVLEADRLPRKGIPAGTRIVLTDARRSEYALVLIGRE